jgi:hypothetical protein
MSSWISCLSFMSESPRWRDSAVLGVGDVIINHREARCGEFPPDPRSF